MSADIPMPAGRPPRVRIAPSPTGDPHVGTAYVALFNKVFAAKHSGGFVLRIEDTDQTRSTPQSEAAILDSLKWLGIEWDEGPDVGGPHGPYRQSERREIYRRHAQQLVEAGHAYPCFATAEELAEMRREAKARKLNRTYDGRYRELDPEEARQRVEAGESHVIRLKIPRVGNTSFHDALRGVIDFANEQLDDQVLLKSDGMPTYHLANVVDDHLMGITHVIRAEEWISSTPKHVLLYAAFGWEPPIFVHLPLLRNPDKSKISKRRNPVSLEYYQRVGILPEALLNYLGRMGWSMPDEREKFSFDEMIDEFTFSRVSLSGPVFDLKKLDWLNGLYIRELDPGQLLERLAAWMLNRERLAAMLPLVHQRIDRLEDFVEKTTYFFCDDFDHDPAALLPKGRDKKQTYRAMKQAAEALDRCASWSAPAIEEVLRGLLQALSWKPRELFMTVRLIVTGRKATPPLFETMEVIGKARCQARLRTALLALRP